MTGKPIPIRLDDPILDRADDVGAALSERAAGVRVSRSEVLRMAVERGIASLEAELGIGAKPKPTKKRR